MASNETLIPPNFLETIMQIKNPVKAILDSRATKRYEKKIAESQAKIGPYVPQTCPVQIWA